MFNHLLLYKKNLNKKIIKNGKYGNIKIIKDPVQQPYYTSTDNSSKDILILRNISKYYNTKNNKIIFNRNNIHLIGKFIKNKMKKIPLYNSSQTEDKKKVLNNINFSIKENEIFGLLGPNGAGNKKI